MLSMLIMTHIFPQRLFRIEGYTVLRCLSIDHATAGEVLVSMRLGFHCRFRQNLVIKRTHDSNIQQTVTDLSRQHEARSDSNVALLLWLSIPSPYPG